MSRVVHIESDESVISLLADLFTILGGLVAIAVVIWQLSLYSQLQKNSDAIRKKQDEIDAVPDVQKGKVNRSSTPIVQKTLDKMIEVAQKPLIADMKKLERERKFIIDKLLFTTR